MRPLRDRPAPDRTFNTGDAGDDARLEALCDTEPLTVPRRWSHFLHFADEATALLVAERLEPVWETTVRHSPDGEGWMVQALKDDVVLSPHDVASTRAEFTDLAASLGGAYDGWQAWI